ncbi:hypothetical protein RDV64_21060 [Acuticoccus sp. MNP-M23]|uniref:hypothetical protein n=1 Tax=Acuticoccus sp. MNP-M23 TaxID=3072793 RepID=UPI0028151531|nr:hypothetical protein [Acuticoccus sp. MNP-M23]WMS42523.1 hypothetical protein RDV64_21060 [Acuticoccus sp. MNP-M23]
MVLSFVGAIAAASAPALAYSPEVELDTGADAPRSGATLPFTLDTAPGGATESILPAQDGGEEFDGHSADYDATHVPREPRAGLADLRTGETDLPPAVAAARTALLAAAMSGEIDALREIFASQRVAPIVGGYGDMPAAVEALRLQSGDDEGREILAILAEILESGHVAVGKGSTLTYVWPYFAEVPLDALEPPHMVDVYRILTSADVEEIQRQGRYTFYRVGIAPDGRVRYFSAGDIE